MNETKVAHISTVSLALRYLLLNQMLAIQSAGLQVFGISAPGPGLDEVESQGILLFTIPMTRSITPLTDIVAIYRLYRLMRRERFTIVHTHTPKAGLLGQYAALLARVPVRVHTIHGLYFPGHMKPQHRWAFVLMERITMLFSQMNFCQNPEDVSVAVAEHISKPDRIQLIGNGIDVETFHPRARTAEQRAATRLTVGLEPHHKVVGMVARFVVEKGYVELLESVQTVRVLAPGVRFMLIGTTESEKKDALDPDIIRTMGLEDVVLFLGHRDDMVDLYSIMDLLVLPSHREGFPRAPMEAAAMGVPAVVTDIRGCRQTVTEGETGHIVPVRDPEGLAAAMLDLLSDDGKRHAYGEAARAKAIAEFDERQVFERIMRSYENLLETHGGTSTIRAGDA